MLIKLKTRHIIQKVFDEVGQLPPVGRDAVFKTVFDNNSKNYLELISALCFGEGRTGVFLENLRSEMIFWMLGVDGKLEQRAVVLDMRSKIKVLSDDGECVGYLVNTEMQLHPDKSIIERMLFYRAGMIFENLKPGVDYDQYMPAISCLITRKSLEFLKDAPGYIHILKTSHEGNPEIVCPSSGFFVVVELSKFMKSLDEIDNVIDAWLYLAKHSQDMSRDDCIRFCEQGDIMEEAMLIVAQETLKPSMKEVLVRLQQQDEVLDQAKAEAKAKGRAEGEARGEAKTTRMMASNFLKQGVKPAVVQAATVLSAKEAAHIAQGLNA